MISRLLSIAVAACLAFAGAASAQGKAELLWYSQAGFKLTTPGGKVIMIDPWILGGPLTPAEFKAAMGQTNIQIIDATLGTKKEF